MSAQVIFLKPHAISREEEIRRAELQYWLQQAYSGMSNRVFDMPPYWRSIEKTKFHQYLKDKIKIQKIEVTDEACL